MQGDRDILEIFGKSRIWQERKIDGYRMVPIIDVYKVWVSGEGSIPKAVDRFFLHWL